MARLESQAKMGYYPTPLKTLEHIKERLSLQPGSVLLDPCCGEGHALKEIAKRFISYGIELDTNRVGKASKILNSVLSGSIFDVVSRPLGCFSLLYLNPPYDWQDGERMEYLFLKQSHKWLKPGGVLVYIVPEHVLDTKKIIGWIRKKYTDIQVYKIERSEYPAFNQVVLFGVKQDNEDERFPAQPFNHIEEEEFLYEVPQGTHPSVFELQGIRPEDIKAQKAISVKRVIETVYGVEKGDSRILSPLFPLRKGHLVSLLMSGVLNGELKKGLVFKCFTERHQMTRTEGEKEITTDTYVSGIRVIEKGRWYDVT